VVGLQSFFLGCIVQVIYNYYPAASVRWLHLFRFDRAMVATGLMFALGIGMSAPLLREYTREGLWLPQGGVPFHMAVTGLFWMIAAFHTFGATLMVNASTMRLRPRKRR
jgi:hypothetical protein